MYLPTTKIRWEVRSGDSTICCSEASLDGDVTVAVAHAASQLPNIKIENSNFLGHSAFIFSTILWHLRMHLPKQYGQRHGMLCEEKSLHEAVLGVTQNACNQRPTEKSSCPEGGARPDTMVCFREVFA